ncbi:MAG: hypothetical protein GC168_16845 [Candidatus Hydrogenedens sp.]|nr:hypothetical protein [Candidatus Hydrogenedens sp.]
MASETGSPRAPFRAYAVLTGVFFAVHAAYWAAGVRFDRSSLDGVMHFLDPELLRTRLLESLWYLHIQPPLFNLFTGLVLKVTPKSPWLFHLIFLALGLNLYLCAFTLSVRLGVRRGLAAVLATLLMASPGFILWEHFLLYEFPAASLLALAAVLLFRVAERGTWGSIAGFFLCLFIVCGIRSLFHWAYLVLVLGALLAMLPQYRRRLLIVGLVPVLLLGAFYAKNAALFGSFTASTFVDKNLWIMTAGNIGWEEKQQLVAAGKLSPLSLVNRWASLDAYPPEYREVPERFAGIPALAETHKRNGEVNYNHYGNIAICKVYGQDARYVLFHRPEAYLAAVAMSAYRFLGPTDSPPVSPQNKAAMPWALGFYNKVVYAQFPLDLRPHIPWLARAGFTPYLSLFLGLPAAFLFGVWSLVRWCRSTRTLRLDPQRLVLGFLLANIVVVAVLGCALDFHETARYRFLVSAFSVALMGMLLEAAWNRLAARTRS